MSTFIAETELATLRPVGAKTERVLVRIQSLVAEKISAEAAEIFAEPVDSRDGSALSWYVDADGDVIPLSALEGAEAERLRTRLGDWLDRMRAVAEEMIASGKTTRIRQTGTALLNATVFPGDDAVYALRQGEKLSPIVIGWGYEPQDATRKHAFDVSALGPLNPARKAKIASAQGAPAAAMGAPIGAAGAAATAGAAAAAQPLPTKDAAAGGPRRRMLVPAALTALAFILLIAFTASAMAYLLPACGLRTPFGTIAFGWPGEAHCALELPEPPPPAEPDSELAALQSEVLFLRQEARNRQIACFRDERQRVVTLQEQLDLLRNEFDAERTARLEAERLAGERALARRSQPERPVEQSAGIDRVGQRGAAQIALSWDTTDDLDLHLECPGGGRIYFGNRANRQCGGLLDVDANASQVRSDPAENITFAQGMSLPGDYRVSVHGFRVRSGNSVPYQLTIRRGDQVETFRGSVGPGQRQARTFRP